MRCVLGLLLTCSTLALTDGKMNITDNAYMGITIAIHKDVPENALLLSKIETAFTKASQFLYEATRRRAYFGEIIVLIPQTWQYKPMYDIARMETYGSSDYRLERTESLANNNPRTLQFRGCGIPGIRTVLTDGFFLNDSVPLDLGALEKVLVHEWGHLRFGVFDEYPQSAEQNFYKDSAGKIEGSRCSRANTGSKSLLNGATECSETGQLPFTSCEFEDDAIPGTGYGSLMYRQFLPQITEFCDDDPNNAKTKHNPDAVTQHNTQCNGRSVWDVMNSHEDFKNVNLAVSISDTKPVFRFVRAHSARARVVLVLDVSGSMAGLRLDKLSKGCYYFISYIASECISVSIVTFNSIADKQHDLVKLDSTSKASLIDALPDTAAGSTSIGHGLQKALEILDLDGGNIILVSDGMENEAPFIAEVKGNVVDAGVKVHSIAITQAADNNIDGIARESGGKSFIFKPENSSESLFGAFQEIHNAIALGSECEDKIIKVHDGSVSTTSGNDRFFISPDVSMDTRVISEYQGSPNVEFYLESSSGQQYGPGSAEYSCQKKSNICVFEFSSIKTGSWTYSVRTTDGSSASASVTVVGKNPSTTIKAIEAEVYWHLSAIDDIDVGTETIQTIHGTVSQGYLPVVHVDVTVTVERPGNDGPVTLVLLDNGVGADIKKDDGIYSGFFSAFTAPGRYGSVVSVESTSGSAISGHSTLGVDRESPAASASGFQSSSAPDVPTGEFQRSVSGQSFQLMAFTGQGQVIYSPARISDLTVKDFNNNDRSVTLTWTAVGAELDTGTASQYEIRYANDSTSLRSSFDQQRIVVQDTIVNGADQNKPKDAGQTEVFIIVLPEGYLVYYLAVVAIDNNRSENASSPVSNVVPVHLEHPLVMTLENKTETDWADSMSNKTETGWIGSTSFIASMTLALLVVVIFISVVMYFRIKIRSQHYDLQTSDQQRRTQIHENVLSPQTSKPTGPPKVSNATHPPTPTSPAETFTIQID